LSTWGFGAFENDNALAWLGDLKDAPNQTILNNALQLVINASVPPEHDCNEALASAEVVAALHNSPAYSLPKEVTDWVKAHPDTTDALREKALLTTEVILTDSKLRQYWVEEDDLDVWKDELEDLILRLK
jgi:hypothetical protein